MEKEILEQWYILNVTDFLSSSFISLSNHESLSSQAQNILVHPFSKCLSKIYTYLSRELETVILERPWQKRMDP